MAWRSTMMWVGATVAAAGAAQPLQAQMNVRVLGNSPARHCFEAIEAVAPAAEARATCDAALRDERLLAADRARTLVNRGVARLRGGNVAAALADFDAALAIEPEQAEAWLGKGMATASEEQAAAAVPMFDRALANDVRRPELAYYGRGVANELSGQVAAAYADYRQAAAIAPAWQAPRSELARFTVVRR